MISLGTQACPDPSLGLGHLQHMHLAHTEWVGFSCERTCKTCIYNCVLRGLQARQPNQSASTQPQTRLKHVCTAAQTSSAAFERSTDMPCSSNCLARAAAAAATRRQGSEASSGAGSREMTCADDYDTSCDEANQADIN